MPKRSRKADAEPLTALTQTRLPITRIVHYPHLELTTPVSARSHNLPSTNSKVEGAETQGKMSD
eukprot:2220432-Rhodomonas_salina.2